MAATWRTRRVDLDKLLPDIKRSLQDEISLQDHQAGKIVQCLNSDHPGELLDLLEYHVNQDAHTASRSNRLFQNVAQLLLKQKRDFTVVHTLAEEPSIGTSVTVVVSRNLGSSKRVYAVKTISKSAALKLEGQTSISHERDILVQAAKSKSPHAPLLIAATQDATHLNLVLEYLPAGDIGLLLTERKVLPLKWVRFWTAETLQAIVWLHELGYAHRDIKPANILLELSGHAKLADYGSAGPLYKANGGLSVMKKYCLSPVGTVDYIAPDILLAHEKAVMDSDDEDDDEEEGLNSPGAYDASVDLWSLGVTVYEMLTGRLPFYAETIPETYEKILKHANHFNLEQLRIDGAAKSLLQQLVSGPERRITSQSASMHPFFANVSWTTLRAVAAPFLPPSRSLEGRNGNTSNEDFSRGFDFSALFSSPGLSILRNAGPDETDLRWLGFTFLPDAHAFDARPSDINESHLLPEAQRHNATAAAYPTTPARSSVPPKNMHSSTRPRQNVQALQEVVTYGILKTAKKATATAARRRASASQDEPLSPIRSRLPDLEKRHEDLLSRISDLENRYTDLFSSTKHL